MTTSLFSAVAGVACVGTWIVVDRFSPGENLLGNHDQGMYLGAAIQLARTGHLKTPVPTLKSLTDEQKSLLLVQSPVQFTRGVESERDSLWGISLGFPLDDQSTRSGPASPHFPAGAATVFGSALARTGWNGVQAVNWLATSIAVLSLAWMAGKHFGPLAGLATVALLLAHPLLTWAANRHYAEPLLFALWTSGLVLLAGSRPPHILAAVTAGFLFTSAIVIKIDAVLIFPGLLVALFVSRINRRTVVALLAGSTGGTAIAAPLLATQSAAYFTGNALSLSSNFAAVSGAVGLGLLVSFLGYARLSKRRSRLNCAAWWGFIGTTVVAALVLYLGRENPTAPDTYFHSGPGREIVSYREETLRRLDWYWLPLGLLPALVGSILLGRRYRSPEIAVFVTCGLLALIIFGHDLYCDPRQPYAMRRLAVFAIPLLLVGIACGADHRRAVWVRTIFSVIAIAQVGAGMQAHRRLRETPEYAGTRAFCEELTAALPPDAVVLVPRRSVLATVAMNSRFIGGRDVWIVNFDKTDPSNEDALRSMLASWFADGKPVVVLAGNSRDSVFPGQSSRNIATVHWQTSWQPGSYSGSSDRVRTIDTSCYVNELLAPRTPANP